jgi:hypothetical protein
VRRCREGQDVLFGTTDNSNSSLLSLVHPFGKRRDDLADAGEERSGGGRHFVGVSGVELGDAS